ncbi:metalloregulator ArsR/SmtB family transcription factor [Patescibacteria group bacterium]|nr:metalloregulator ArsR/SmtB family transcription factor [Patescibacteria group bacterium]MBU1123933.1 metalloregulator ArsR/SmtB family transcription factor [Patescibacteria group bacterium]MBU1911645.1 metalloregulator ArsR/SmtB family transcription factor [Patescibacteria group bacterium]
MTNLPQLEHNLKALSNLKRLQICAFLKKNGSTSVGEIAKAIGSSLRATSQNIKILYSAGLLVRRKRNFFVFYRIASPQEEPIRKILSVL